MTTLRVVSIDPRLARTVRSWGSAEERARRVALLVGSAEIQQHRPDGTWQTVEAFRRDGGRVVRAEDA